MLERRENGRTMHRFPSSSIGYTAAAYGAAEKLQGTACATSPWGTSFLEHPNLRGSIDRCPALSRRCTCAGSVADAHPGTTGG